MNKLEIAKKMQDNQYECSGICDECPFVPATCGATRETNYDYRKRIIIVQNYIKANNDKETKSKSKYVPFDKPNPELKGKWIKDKITHREFPIDGFDPDDIECYLTVDRWYSNEELFNDFTFEDGSPIGRKVNE